MEANDVDAIVAQGLEPGGHRGLIYRLSSSKAQIVAVAHRRRRPGYWRLRK